MELDMWQLEPADAKRRRLLLCGSLLAGSGLAGLALIHVRAARPLTDQLMEDAAAFIDQRFVQQGHSLVRLPVSTLQRQFRLGYRRACALLLALVNRNGWVITSDVDGVRALLLVSEPAA
jgi:DNA segregation ATPase FtsK/SpoIIIE-like protein